MTPSITTIAATLLTDSPAAPYPGLLGGAEHSHDGVSLLHGWLPATIEAVAATMLLLAIGWRSYRWRMLWLPLAVVAGVGAASGAHWYVDSEGLADDPAPRALWIWIGLTGLAVGVMLLGWPGVRWWRRGASVLAVLMCLLSSGVALNLWVGYFPTVQTVWNQLTSGPLPDETDWAAVTAMQRNGTVPPTAPSSR